MGVEGVAAAVQTNPFPGLRPFREEEEYLFFGRESQVDAMVDKLAATRFLAVVGASGSGKSSLVNCGLRPALRRGLMASAGTAWRMAQFRPGGEPLRAMARALARDGVLFRGYEAAGLTLAEVIETTLRMSKLGLVDIYEQARLGEAVNLLLVVDQFEELFRYRLLSEAQHEAGPGARAGVGEDAIAFVNLLLEAGQQTTCPIYVVLTMRSDFLGDCAQFPGLPEAINAGQYLVPRMTRDERRAAIGGPVRVSGAEISPVLLTRLVNDVGDDPDQLSILQHALNRTWARWHHESATGPLALTQYEAIGTMAHALDRHAEKAYTELGSERQREICGKLFKALTDKATDPRGVRRPTRLGTLCALCNATEEEVSAVIEVFRKPSRSFVMPPAGETLRPETVIDISHESLMRVWHRLKIWAEAEAQSADMYRRVAETAALHAEGRAGLWRDPELQLALDWRAHNQPNETWAQRYRAGFTAAMCFLEESLQAREAEQAAEQERERREREVLERLAAEQTRRAEEQTRYAAKIRRALIAAIMIGVGAVLASILAAISWIAAERSYKEALANNLAFISSRLLVDGDFSRAIGVAKEAFEVDGEPLTPAVEQTMTQNYAHVLLTKKGLYQHVLRHEGPVSQVAVSPNGSRIVTTSADDSAGLWDTKGNLLNEMRQGESVQHAAFFHDGSGMITVGYGHLVRMWDQDGHHVKDLVGHGCRPEYNFCNVNEVGIAPDDGTIVTVSSDQKVIVWSRDGEKRAVLDDHGRENGGVLHVAFSPNGQYFATSGGDWDKTVQLYDVRGQHIARLSSAECLESNHWDCAVSKVAFSPTDESLWMAAFPDRTVRLYDVRGKLRTTYPGHQGRINSVAYHPDGNMFVTASNDKTAILWTVEGHQQQVLKEHTGAVTMATFSPDGRYIATSSTDKTAKLWDLEGNLLTSYEGHASGVGSVAFSPDSRFLVTASQDKTARLWKTQPIRVPILKHDAGVAAASFLPDGERVLTAETGPKPMVVRLWGETTPTDTGHEAYRVLRTYEGFGPDHRGNRRIYSLEVSPDGKRFVTTGTDYTVRVWEVDSGNVIRQWQDDKGCNATGWCGPLNARYSADGQYIMTGDYGGNVKIYDSQGHLLRKIQAHDKEVRGIDMSRDNKYLVTASNDETIKLWDFQTGQLQETFRGHTKGVCCVTFSSDGRKILSGSDDATIKLWDRSGNIPFDAAHASAIASVEFSPTKDRILSSSLDGTGKVWDIEGNLVKTLEGHESLLTSAHFSPDGETIITASFDDTARIWFSARQMYDWIERHEDSFYHLTCKDKQELRIPSDDCEPSR